MTQDERWHRHLKALQQYIERTGTTKVPSGHIEQIDGSPVLLGNWVSHQRQAYRNGMLRTDRAGALNQISGWEWGPLSRGPQPDGDRDRRILQLCDNGLSLQQVADQVNLSRQRVHQILKRAKTKA